MRFRALLFLAALPAAFAQLATEFNPPKANCCCTVLPISDYTERPQSQRRPPADILALNAWIKEYATRTGATIADYYTATMDEKGFLKDGFSGDGLHPNAKGYERMAPVAQAAIDKALR